MLSKSCSFPTLIVLAPRTVESHDMHTLIHALLILYNLLPFLWKLFGAFTMLLIAEHRSQMEVYNFAVPVGSGSQF